MNMSLELLTIVVLMCTPVFAQSPAWPPSADHPTQMLWPNGAPGPKISTGPEGDTTTSKDRLVAGKRVIRIGNVSSPTLTLYKPTARSSGTALVVFPGGSYKILAIHLEGTEVC